MSVLSSPAVSAPDQITVSFLNINQIYDYLPWSVVNLVLGSIFCAGPALAASSECIERKRANDYAGAQSKSRQALILNSVATLVGLIAWGVMIALIIVAR